MVTEISVSAGCEKDSSALQSTLANSILMKCGSCASNVSDAIPIQLDIHGIHQKDCARLQKDYLPPSIFSTLMHVIHSLNRFDADAQLVLAATGPIERYRMTPINLLRNNITT